MPRVQFVNVVQGINVTRDMTTPKRMTELSKWLKGAQAAIKEIPRVIADSEISANRSIGSDGWFVSNTDIDIKWIKFNLESRWGGRADIVIDRQSNAFSR